MTSWELWETFPEVKEPLELTQTPEHSRAETNIKDPAQINQSSGSCSYDHDVPPPLHLELLQYAFAIF